MALLTLLLALFSGPLHASCHTSRDAFSTKLDSLVLGADDSLKRSAFPYADLLFDSSNELFDGLAAHDTGYVLSGVTWMWDINPSRVLVLRAYPSVEGVVCISQYTASIVVYYGTPFKLPAVRADD